MKFETRALALKCVLPLALIISPIISHADDPKEDNSKVLPVAIPVKIVRSYKLDELVHYDVTMKLNIMGAEILIVTGNKLTAKEMKKDGSAVVLEEPELMKVTSGGVTQKAPGNKPWKEVRDNRGILKDYIVDDDPAAVTSPNGLRLIASMSDVLLPEKEVKSGESWETELDNPTRTNKKYKIKSTLLGIEKIDGVDYLKIDQMAEAAFEIESSKMSYHLIAWVDTTNGQMFKTHGILKGLPTQSGGIGWDLSMQRTKPK